MKKAKFSLFNKLSTIYKGVDPDSVEGKYIADMRKAVKPIRDAFMEGVAQASKNVEAKKKASANTTTEAQNKSEVYTQYTQSLEAIYNETFPSDKNTHIKVLNNTPKIYIDKADASDRSIEMSWDIAYLAMKKSGNIKGNYHGLGIDVMKALPQALEDPLYIVKQKNGRIAAVTEIVVKGKRAVFASIELEAYQTVKKDGKTLSDTYNLIVTVTDAKPNYLQNTIFSGDVVYNKNQEDPSHFILRLKSLNKALPTYDREGSSKVSIAQSEKEVKTVLKKSRATSEQDSTYLDAVKRGDMETAQKMVEDAAKDAGYDYHLYHGTDADFTVFDLRKYGGQNGKGEGYGIYLAANREVSTPYGKNVIDSYTKFNRLAEGSKKTLSYAEVKKIVEKSCELDAQRAVEDGEYDSVDEAIRDTWVSNVVYTYDYSSMSQVYTDVSNSLWKQNDNDGELINEIMALSGAHYDYRNALNFYETVLTPTTGIDGFHYIWGNKDGSGVQNDIYLAFNSEQVKSADPVTYDDNGNVIPLSERFNEKSKDIRYKSRSSVDKYTLKEYNSFGWVRDNNVLTSDEYKNFTTEISKAVTSKAYSTDKTDLGEYMIPVGKMYGVNEGVKNKIVFAKGTIANPEITRIVEIDGDNETFLSNEREYIYALEKQGIRTEADDLFKVHTSINARSASSGQRSSNENARNNNQLGADRRAGSRTTPKIKEILFDDQGNEVSRIVRSKARTSYTAGQMAKMKANLSQQKVYSKVDTMKLVKELAPGIRKRSFDMLTEKLWEGFNTYVTGADRRVFANDMAL